jgi:hypothetical protein
MWHGASRSATPKENFDRVRRGEPRPRHARLRIGQTNEPCGGVAAELENNMSKLVKSKKNEWVVVDNDAIFRNNDGDLINRDGTPSIPTGKQRRVFGCGDRIPEENSGFLGLIHFYGDGLFTFDPATGVEHSSDDLREIADLMDSLAGKADAAKA